MKRVRVLRFVRSLWIASLASAVIAGETSSNEVSYRSFDDASWAIHDRVLSDRLGSNRQEAYDDFMKSCRLSVVNNPDDPTDLCGHEDAYRRYMNTYQPLSVLNYTTTGFLKTRIPDDLWKTLQQFWNDNKNSQIPVEATAHSYHNPWEAELTMINVLSDQWVGGGNHLYAQIAASVQEVMEAWTGGVPQSITSIYGIRIYPRHSVLAPHVDRIPLVSSAILHIAHDDSEHSNSWELEVYGHDGVAHNVTMEPGDMVFYESLSVIHGRPFPLQGEYYANLFVHFEPLLPPMGSGSGMSADQTQTDDDEVQVLPPYLLPDSVWVDEWIQANPSGHWHVDPLVLAQKGDLKSLKYVAAMSSSNSTDKSSEKDLCVRDAQGWQPLHEAIRAGHTQLVEFLLGQCEESEVLTPDPLAIARRFLPPGHEIIDMLLSYEKEKAKQEQGGHEEF